MELIRGRAEFTDAREVTVDGVTYTADHIIIATGGHPTLLDIPGETSGVVCRCHGCCIDWLQPVQARS